MAPPWNRRTHPAGPPHSGGGDTALRGPKRTGPIRAVVPGDDFEVAREIARLWEFHYSLLRKINRAQNTADNVDFSTIQAQVDSLSASFTILDQSGPTMGSVLFSGGASSGSPQTRGINSSYGAANSDVENYKHWVDRGYALFVQGYFTGLGGAVNRVDELGVRCRRPNASTTDALLQFYNPRLSDNASAMTPVVKCSFLTTGMADTDTLELASFVGTTSVLFDWDVATSEIIWFWALADYEPPPVLPAGVANGDFVIYNTATGVWESVTLADAYVPDGAKIQSHKTITTPSSTKTTAYTAAITDDLIICDATSAAFTVTLPAASGLSGRAFTIKKIDVSANAVTVDGDSAETIDGAATYVLGSQWEMVTVVCNGTNWYVMDAYAGTPL